MERPVRSAYMDIVEQRALDGDLYRVTIAANEKVRQPPELDFVGLSTENYSRNPVVMWAHDSVGRSPSGGLPIGRTLDLKKTPKGEIVAEFEFLSDDPFSRRVKNAWDKGFLQAASISWLPLESEPVQGGGWRDTRSDLLEWSIVSVPADPEALRKSHRRLMDIFLRVPVVGAHQTVSSDHQRETPAGEGREGSEIRRADRRLVLSSDDYNDLSSSMALLKDVLERTLTEGSSGAPPALEGADGRPADSDLTELRALVGEIKKAVLSS